MPNGGSLSRRGATPPPPRPPEDRPPRSGNSPRLRIALVLVPLAALVWSVCVSVTPNPAWIVAYNWTVNVPLGCFCAWIWNKAGAT